MVPDFFHVVPVGDNTMLDGVLEGQHPTLGLGLVTSPKVSAWDKPTNAITCPT
jgi:hypothetical protein